MVWDQATSLLIAQVAGAKVVDLDPPTEDAMRVMVTNGKLTEQLLKVCSDTK